MALIKEITLGNGIVVNYHRVVRVNNVTNNASIIEVASYTSKEKREEEKTKLANKEPMDVYIYTEYFDLPYDANFNVNSAYEYLKTLDKFSDSLND